MLPKANRLKKDKDIERVFKYGKGYKEKFLFLKVRENNLKTSRFAFVVGKRVAKQAVSRNAIKRRLRAIIKSRLSEVGGGIDAVFVVLRLASRDESIGLITNKLLAKARLILKI